MTSEPTAFVSLSFCGSELRLTRSARARIARRDNVGPFSGPGPTAAPVFALETGFPGGDGWAWFETSSGATGRYRAVPTGVQISEETNDLGLALALRGLFSLAIERSGGVLVHASCVSWNGEAALVTGVSGAGKSTLARWATHAGATLLSDEVVGVLPDGRVLGTPFRSDPDLLGTPTTARLTTVLTPRHAVQEDFEPQPGHRMLQLLLEQTFHRGGEISARQALACLRPALEGVRTGVFACRNVPEAGHALRDLLSHGP